MDSVVSSLIVPKYCTPYKPELILVDCVTSFVFLDSPDKPDFKRDLCQWFSAKQSSTVCAFKFYLFTFLIVLPSPGL